MTKTDKALPLVTTIFTNAGWLFTVHVHCRNQSGSSYAARGVCDCESMPYPWQEGCRLIPWENAVNSVCVVHPAMNPGSVSPNTRLCSQSMLSFFSKKRLFLWNECWEHESMSVEMQFLSYRYTNVCTDHAARAEKTQTHNQTNTHTFKHTHKHTQTLSPLV